MFRVQGLVGFRADTLSELRFRVLEDTLQVKKGICVCLSESSHLCFGVLMRIHKVSIHWY